MADEWDPAAVEWLREAIREWIAARDVAVVAEMEERLADEPNLSIDGRCLLFGFDGQVDVAWDVPEPRPEVLERPLPLTARQMLAPVEVYTPSVNVAEYRRVGEFTYQRTA